MVTIEYEKAGPELREIIRQLEAGEPEVLLMRNGRTVGKVEVVQGGNAAQRAYGFDKGKYEVTDAFFEPLPSDIDYPPTFRD